MSSKTAQPKRPAVFLDRDGTLNREVDVLRHLKQLRVLPGVPEAVRALNRAGYMTIVVTNQAVIGRGWLTEAGLGEIHDVLRMRLAREGARIDALYYCPHHPNANLKKYRAVCVCRKPGIGMIRQAAKAHNIDLKKSFLVGDHTRDILTGKRAGLTTVLVKTGYGGKDGHYDIKADYTARDLREAVKFIRKHDA